MGEWFNFPANSKLMRPLRSLGDMPIIVLTHDPSVAKPAGVVPPQWETLIEPVWQQLQVQLASLSTNSQHVIVAHAGHNIQLEQPQVVIDAILKIIDRARAKSRASR